MLIAIIALSVIDHAVIAGILTKLSKGGLVVISFTCQLGWPHSAQIILYFCICEGVFGLAYELVGSVN